MDRLLLTSWARRPRWCRDYAQRRGEPNWRCQIAVNSRAKLRARAVSCLALSDCAHLDERQCARGGERERRRQPTRSRSRRTAAGRNAAISGLNRDDRASVARKNSEIPIRSSITVKISPPSGRAARRRRWPGSSQIRSAPAKDRTPLLGPRRPRTHADHRGGQQREARASNYRKREHRQDCGRHRPERSCALLRAVRQALDIAVALISGTKPLPSPHRSDHRNTQTCESQPMALGRS